MIKYIAKLSLILLTVCGICAALVTSAFSLTKATIDGRIADKITAGYKEVFPKAGTLTKEKLPGLPEIKEIQRSKVGEQTTGFIYTVGTQGYSSEVLVMVGIELPSVRITGVKILEQHETPGLGAKCTESAFTEQFAATSLKAPLIVSRNAKNDTEIQAITASTITSRAVVKAINLARLHLQDNYLTTAAPTK